MKRSSALLVILLLTACSGGTIHNCVDIQTDAKGDPFDACDPGSAVNRQVFEFNLFTDYNVIGPVTHFYHREMPKDGRDAVDHFLTNLSEPANMVNSTLQGDMQSAGTTLWRFLLNSTFGFAGLRDFAGENGLKYNEQNFGMTLGSYGVADGAYVVLPIAGPSSVRDTTGRVVDWFLDPVGWYLSTPQSLIQGVATGLDDRDRNNGVIDQFYYRSLDPYSATRAAYLQHQAFQ